MLSINLDIGNVVLEDGWDVDLCALSISIRGFIDVYVSDSMCEDRCCSVVSAVREGRRAV